MKKGETEWCFQFLFVGQPSVMLCYDTSADLVRTALFPDLSIKPSLCLLLLPDLLEHFHDRHRPRIEPLTRCKFKICNSLHWMECAYYLVTSGFRRLPLLCIFYDCSLNKQLAFVKFSLPTSAFGSSLQNVICVPQNNCGIQPNLSVQNCKMITQYLINDLNRAVTSNDNQTNLK